MSISMLFFFFFYLFSEGVEIVETEETESVLSGVVSIHIFEMSIFLLTFECAVC